MPRASWVDIVNLLTIGGLDAQAIRVALLQKQYFPAVKSAGEEIPEIFSSETVSLGCAQELAALGKSHAWASWVEFRARRFDGLVRRFGVPHPVPYSRLVLHVADHWSELAPLLDGAQSQVKPTFHRDGRIFQMNYEAPDTTLSRDTRLAQGREFLVKADISNCFPSIYSHSIDWATRGKKVAKRAGGRDGSWQARLDELVRNCHDRETKGVMIGPAVSNLLAELVLQRVDESLVSSGHDFVRYVDDYTTYCVDRSAAEAFVVDLQRALSEFRLDLNTRKTKIIDLRHGVGEPWMAEVRSHLPKKSTPLSDARFLRHSELLAARYPLNSVLKFAVKSLRGRKKRKASVLVVDELVRLCAFHPHLAPFLAAEMAELGDDLPRADADRLAPVLRALMLEAAARAETDVVLWHLHILRRVLKAPVNKAIWQHLLAMEDQMVLVALAAMCPRARPAIAGRVRNWDYLCESDYQQNWLVRYEFWRSGLLVDLDLSPAELQWMAIMKKHDVVLSCLGVR